MDAILARIDSWIVAIVVGAVMTAGWAYGLWRGSRKPPGEPSAADATFSGASMALLGLLLGFTFSMSLTKYEQRRQMVITDSNAIGDFATSAAMLKDPVRGQLKKQIRDYVEHRLGVAKAVVRPVDDSEVLAEVPKTHAAMTASVKEAVDAGTPVAVPLVATLNGLTSSHAARVAAVHDRIPWSIVMLLAVAGGITMVLIGIHQGAAGHRQATGTISFVVLVALVVWVIMDLNQPRRGLITVSQEPMEMLLKEL